MSQSNPDNPTPRQALERNNRPHTDHEDLPSIMPNELADREMECLLRKNRILSGFLVDEHSGPIQSIHQVAVYKIDGQYYSPAWVREENCMDSETIRTRYERDSNYIHQGWSLSAISTLSPWISSRISSNNRSTQEGPWVTQRTIVQRLAVKVPSEDLKPSAEFEADVRAALQKSIKCERFQALYTALNYWGDVVPLVYDLGMSLTVTDLERNIIPDNSWLGRDPKMSKTARPNTKGGKAGLNDKGVGCWISQELLPKDWRIVRVTKVIPTLHLLDTELRDQIADLWSVILSFIPQTLDGATGGHQTWDDSLHPFKTISRSNNSDRQPRGQFTSSIRGLQPIGPTWGVRWHRTYI